MNTKQHVLQYRAFPKRISKIYSTDLEFFATHLTPDQQNKLAQIVGRKCIIMGKLGNRTSNVLWDTGAQFCSKY